jgi:glycosyltransferase involved in cell wall biosynthesis
LRGEPAIEPDVNQTDDTKVPVSVVVMTYNEERNLSRCLDSVCAHAGEILIVDSFSTDATLEIARRYTDRIYQHAYESHPQQWRWALPTLPFAHEWVFAIDADVAVTPALWRAIEGAVRGEDATIDGYFVRHRQVFRGRWLRHGTMYPRYRLLVFRRHKVRIDPDDMVDGQFWVGGRTGRLSEDVIEDNAKDRDIAFWIQKQLRFADRHAAEELRLSRAGRDGGERATLFGNPAQQILWLKRVWRSLPLYVRPWLLFGYRYVFRLGFLDGRAGFLYHFTQALVYRTLVDVRLDELRSGSSHTAIGVTVGRAAGRDQE